MYYYLYTFALTEITSKLHKTNLIEKLMRLRHITHTILGNIFIRKGITHAKSSNLILYIKTKSANYIKSIFRTMCCLYCTLLSNYTLLK